MPGYRYEILLRDGSLVRRSAYWSAYRLLPGSKVMVGDRLAVVEETRETRVENADFVAHCRLARQDELLI
jgi:hypothetical protein